jgi:hypothetical protein
VLAWQRIMHGEEFLRINGINSLCSFCSEIQNKSSMNPKRYLVLEELNNMSGKKL